jgi:Tol biopolymer transport system component
MTIRSSRWIHSESVATCLLLSLLFGGWPFLLPMPAAAQQPPRREVESYLEIYDLRTGQRQVVHREEGRFEAPNWTKDGQFLLINRQGKLYRLPVKGGSPQEIPTGFANQLNNDHGISPDGKMLAISHNNREIAPRENSAIYVVPLDGGTPRPVTSQVPSYWHGWSPNGRLLAYVAKRNGDYNIFTIPVEGGEERQLTDAPGLDDGPDYTPDGRHIYFNSVRSGKMQIWRMKADGSGQTQVTTDGFNNWFPHPSPDGKRVVFLSYLEPIDPATHPANQPVALRLLDLATGEVRELCRLMGGQGTINVPSWSPDGQRFAFVSYHWLSREPATR